METKKVDIEKIKEKLETIDDNALLNAKQIADYDLIFNTNLEGSRYTVYRRIKGGDLPAVNVGTKNSPKYFVKGKDLKEYVRETLDI